MASIEVRNRLSFNGSTLAYVLIKNLVHSMAGNKSRISRARHSINITLLQYVSKIL